MHKDSQQASDINELSSKIHDMCVSGELRPTEVEKLFEQIIEHKLVVPCIRSLPPTSVGYNPWHSKSVQKDSSS